MAEFGFLLATFQSQVQHFTFTPRKSMCYLDEALNTCFSAGGTSVPGHAGERMGRIFVQKFGLHRWWWVRWWRQLDHGSTLCGMLTRYNWIEQTYFPGESFFSCHHWTIMCWRKCLNERDCILNAFILIITLFSGEPREWFEYGEISVPARCDFSNSWMLLHYCV